MNKYSFRTQGYHVRTPYEMHMDSKYNIHAKYCMFLKQGGGSSSEFPAVTIWAASASQADVQAEMLKNATLIKGIIKSVYKENAMKEIQ